MYIRAYRAHFCHLLGLGQVGHSLRETSGSAGSLDWGPMWLGSQSTCHPLMPLLPPDTPYTPDSPNIPYTPTSGSTGTLDWGPMWSGFQSICHLPILATPPDTPTPPDSPNASHGPNIPLHPCHWECWDPGLGPMWSDSQSTCHPNASYTLLTPLHPLMAPWHPNTPIPLPVGVLGPWTGAQCGQAPSQPATSMHPWHPLYPLPAPDTPWCSYTPASPYTLLIPYTSAGPSAPTIPPRPNAPVRPPFTPC